MTYSDEQAFPGLDTEEAANKYCPGLTKREYFAANALQGLLANDRKYHEVFESLSDLDEYLATRAVELADQLLQRLDQ